MLTWLNNHITIEGVLLLFPIAFMFHDFEEILTVESWMEKYRSKLETILPPKMLNLIKSRFHITTLDFAKDVLLIFLVISLATLYTVLFKQYSLFLILLAIFFLHSFTHLGQSIFLKNYTPGVMTSIFLVIPYSIYTYYRLLTTNIINLDDLYWSGLSTLITGPLLFFLLTKWRGKTNTNT